MEGLPVKWEDDEVFVSHTFLDFGELDFGARIPEYLWNRSEPVSQDRFQIAGHNSHFGVRLWMSDLYSGQVAYALSIDASATKQIAGVDLNTMRIYTQEYI